MDFNPLEVAKNGCFSLLNIVLDNLHIYNFNVDTQDVEGNSILHYTAQSGHQEIIEKLLHLNANINILNKKGSTPLHLACYHGHIEIIKLLLENGAKVNAADFAGETPIFKSLKGRQKKVTKFLIVNHAAVNITNKVNERLLHLAVKFDDYELAKVLLNVDDVNVMSYEGYTPVQMAVKLSNKQLLSLLVTHKADLNIRDSHGNSLLHLAVTSGDSWICEYLIAKGIDVNCINNCDGSTALHFAVEQNKIDIVKLLVDNGADVNQGDLEDYTPLHLAASSSINLDILKFLIERKADLDLRTEHGDLAIHVAASWGNIEAFRLLFSEKYETVVNNCGLTPFKMAEIRGYEEILGVNKRRGKDVVSSKVLVNVNNTHNRYRKEVTFK